MPATLEATRVARPRTAPMHHRDSLTVRYASDLRMQLVSGRTFVMQVAHPAVGAGVHAYSAFREDPWTRLEQITRSGIAYLYRGEEAAFEEGRRLRRLHAGLRGVDSRGRPYHALDPDVYGWVHTVFFDSIVTMNRWFATPLTRSEEERLFLEWRKGGLVFGLDDGDMPSTVDEYWERYDAAIEATLEYNPPVDHILNIADKEPIKPPQLENLGDTVWRALWKPLGRFQRWLILATLPLRYREKIAPHQPWTAADQRSFERMAACVRRAFPRLPAAWRLDPSARGATFDDDRL